MQKRSKTQFEELMECVEDFIQHTEQIDEERLKWAEKEYKLAKLESIAFNLLRQNIKNLKEEYGIS